MQLPDFLGIGVQRGATTWLHTCLDEHPEVFVPASKELHFFNLNFESGVEWYKQQFTPGPQHKAVGEVTPTYLHAAPIARIASVVPDARLIVILRHPVDRACSAYELLREKLPGQTFFEAFRQSDHLKLRSLYADRLREVYEHYPRERVLILLYDDVCTRPFELLRSVFGFLGVRTDFVPPSAAKTLNRIMFSRTQAVFGRLKLSWALEAVKSTPVGNLIRRWHSRGHANNGQRVGTGERAELVKIFLDDIARTEDLIGRDLSAWKK